MSLADAVRIGWDWMRGFSQMKPGFTPTKLELWTESFAKDKREMRLFERLGLVRIGTASGLRLSRPGGTLAGWAKKIGWRFPERV
jgi:hypothetical protein